MCTQQWPDRDRLLLRHEIQHAALYYTVQWPKAGSRNRKVQKVQCLMRLNKLAENWRQTQQTHTKIQYTDIVAVADTDADRDGDRDRDGDGDNGRMNKRTNGARKKIVRHSYNLTAFVA